MKGQKKGKRKKDTKKGKEKNYGRKEKGAIKTEKTREKRMVKREVNV